MAGTIEDLNFKVILNDKDFSAAIERDLEAAQRLNTQISTILDLKKKLNADTTEQLVNAEKVAQAAARTAAEEQKVAQEKAKTKLEEQKVRTEVERTAAAQRQHTDEIKNTNKELVGTEGLMKTITQLTGIGLGLTGIRRFASELVNITGEFEVQKMALTSMLQDANKADEIFNTLRQEALKSPYTFQDLTKYAKQLTAFNIPVDNLVETEKRLADVSAGLGVDMGRIILAYGQVKAAGVLKGTELRQFTEAGVPLLQSLADQIERTEGKTISLSEVFQRISKKQIPFEMVEQAFKDMTDEGGKFYKMQEVLVDTLKGKIGKLRDVWQQTLYDIGNSNSGALKGAVDLLTMLAANFDKIVNIVGVAAAAFTTYKLAIGLAVTAQKALIGAEVIAKWLKLEKAVERVAKMQNAVAAGAKKGAIAFGLLAAAALLLYNHFNKANKAASELQKRLDEIHNSSRNNSEMAEVDRLRDLAKVARDANKSYDERKSAIAQLNQVVPGYHASLSAEGKLIGDNTKLLDKYINKRHAEAKMKGAQDELAQLYQEQREAKRAQEEANKTLELRKKIRDEMQGQTAVSYNIAGTSGSSLGLQTQQYVRQAQQEVNAADKALATIDKRIERVIEEINNMDIAAILGGGGNPLIPLGKEDETTREIRLIEEEIALLEKFRKEYEKLLPIFGEKNIGAALKSFFDPSGDFGYTFDNLDERILALSDRLYGFGGKAAQRAADIKIRFVLEGYEAIEKAKKEAEKAQKDFADAEKKLGDYLSKSFGDVGDGISGKIKKVLNDLSNKNASVDSKIADLISETLGKEEAGWKDKWIKENEEMLNANPLTRENKAMQMALANIYWDQYRKRREEELRAQGEAEKDQNTADANQKISDILNSNVLKEAIKEKYGDIGNLSLMGLSKLRSDLETMALPDSVRQAVGDDVKLLKKLEEEWGNLIEKFPKEEIKPKEKKKLEDLGKTIASSITKIGKSVSELGEASGNDTLESMGEGLQFVGETAGAMMERLKNGDWIGAAIAGVTSIAEKVMEAFVEAERLKKAIREAQESARISNLGDNLQKGIDSVFGSDQMRSIRNALENMRQLRDLLGGDLRKGNIKYKSGFLGLGRTDLNIANAMKELGYELLDEYGNLNSKGLQAILETYTKLTSADKEWIEQAIHNSEAYAEAMKQLEGVASSLFGSLADSLADRFIDNFKKMGDAVYDLGDTFKDLGETILKSLLESYILENILDKYKSDAQGMMSAYANKEISYEEYAEWLKNFTNSVKEESEAQSSAINGLISAFVDRDLVNMGADEASSVGAGIKSITEDTANLLASYMNAMRADLSVMRGLQEKGWQTVDVIGAAMPTLNDYLAQIAATNFDLAQSNQQILSEIQSVIGAEGSSGSIVRVQVAS